MDLKKAAAEKAVSLIKENTVVGIGDGSTMAHVAHFLHEKIKQGFSVTLLTSSFTTQQLLVDYGIDVRPISEFAKIDLYFDGCDQFDHQFNALKSGSGIHTREKMVAQMAKQFILVGDDTKQTKTFSPSVPLVIELLPDMLTFISSRIKKQWPDATLELRRDKASNEPTLTANQNWLLNVNFSIWPELKLVDEHFKSLTGVVAISLFYQLATGAIVASADGVKSLSK